MCGIAGVKRFGKEPITIEEIRVLLLGIEHRGNHATGIALVNPDHSIHVLKNDTPAFKFCVEEQTLDFLGKFLNPETKTVILHTRWATQGSPKVNANNHPMFTNKVAAVHNGMINNDKWLFQNEKLERGCETDSDIIRAILDRDGITPEGVKTLNRMAGSAAIAAITPENPDQLLLARSGSPVKYAVSDEKLWWCSVIEPLHHAVRPWVKKHGLYARRANYDVSFMTMPDNTAYLFDEGGLKNKIEFKSCTYYRQPTYGSLNSSYFNKRQQWDREERQQNRIPAVSTTTATTVTTPASSKPEAESKFGQCPECKRNFTIPLADSWSDYKCTNKSCKYSSDALDFGELDKAVVIQ